MIQLLPVSPVKSMLFGATAAALGSVVLRPALVGAVRVGMTTTDYAKSVWASAKAEAAAIRAEAATGRVRGLEAELQALRAEVAQLKEEKKV